jgi:L-proline amide hydrolase
MEDLSLKLAELQSLYDKEHKELEDLKKFNNLSITLDQLIGDMSHLDCQADQFEIRGLKVAYARYDNPKLPTKPPVIAIHGGPACPHGYILPLKLLAHLGYPVIFYDQAGCGNSTFVEDPEKDAPWLLTMDYYTEELVALISHLKLEEFYVFGSSWGTCVAQEFAVTLPNGLLGLILDGALSDSEIYISTQRRDVLKDVPTFTRDLLFKLDAEKSYDDPIYKKIDRTLSTHFTTRLVPRPDCYFDSLIKSNMKIYVAMQGPSEFSSGGVLEKWSIRSRSHLIRVPTLVQRGQYDTMSEECCQVIVDDIQTAFPLVTIPRAAHCKLIDEPQLCVNSILRFLNTVEAIRDQTKKQLSKT